MRDTVWITANGERILVSQMEYSHLLNAIAKIKRDWPRFRPNALPRLELEITIRDIQGRK